MLDPALKVLVAAQQSTHVLVTLQHCLQHHYEFVDLTPSVSGIPLPGTCAFAEQAGDVKLNIYFCAVPVC